MEKFQSQELMDFVGIVPAAAQMSLHRGFDAFPVEVRPGEASGVKQDLADIIR
jgi:hypothetical protein